MRNIIKNLFTNIESGWEKNKDLYRRLSKEMIVYAKKGNTIRMTYCRDDQPGRRKKEPKEKQRGNPHGAKHKNTLCRKVKVE